jgi:4-carboxymuconolactone decarboxylase
VWYNPPSSKVKHHPDSEREEEAAVMRHSASVVTRAAAWRSLTAVGIAIAALMPIVPSARDAQGTSASREAGSLPPDVHPESRSRLPPLKSGVQGAAALRLHVPANVRWESPLGRAMTELAILVTAREHDQQYEWSLHEMEALAVGLEPGIIDIVRRRSAISGVPDTAAVIIQVGREIGTGHALSSATYARAVTRLGQRDFIGVVDLMATYSATGVRLTAFNQHMPTGWREFLPLPFTPPSDFHADSRSRLPLIRSQTQPAQTSLYARQLAPEGTGPNHIARHAGSLALLEGSMGRRLMALAILVTAREHHAQYDWTTHEATARADGLEPALIDVVRHGRTLAGVGEKEAALIQFGRELLTAHNVSPETYARALRLFGERDLVDVVGLMAQHTADAVLLAAFDQHLPSGQPPLLPVTGGRR